jgi:transcription-repair coupling factor (superfamily II helicase)
MSVRSPFHVAASLPFLAPFIETKGASPRVHSVVSGLLGASRALVAGAAGIARGENFRSGASVVVLVVEGPEAGLDAISDLRAFMSLHKAKATPSSESKGSANSGNGRRPKIQKLADEEKWADRGTTTAANMPEELKQGLLLESALFPAWDVLPTESDRPEGMTLAGRRRATDRLREIRKGGAALPKCFFLAAPITALMQPCEAPGDTVNTLTLKTGEEHDPILLGRKLGDVGYERVGQVEVRGEFALRGGILDIFPYTSDTPYRIDFFGETIESIKPFDPLSQRSDEPVPSISFADASPDSLKKLFSPGASKGPYSLLDHLPAGALIVFQNPKQLRQRAELYQASLVSGRSICFELDELLATSRQKFDTLQFAGGWEQPIGEAETDEPKPAAAPEPEYFHALTDATPEQIACTTLQRVHGDIVTHADAWKRLTAEHAQTVVFCETPGHRQRLTALFEGAGILPSPTLRLVLGKVSGGFDLRAAGLAVAIDREILGFSKHAISEAPATKRKQIPGTVAIAHLMDLQLGDYVVHAAHGIARYLGLARLEKSGRTEDYLTLLFANDVKLYVPAAHIGWVSKYIGGHAEMELSTLGSKVWAKKKERAAAAIRDIAEDLLRVQAARRSMPGIVHPPDSEWQEPFEQAFPYDETPDQISAISAVKKDMEGTCPMDRLLCGDVGFGKTEVALRAAFKTASSGKQVAVLAPTTLLAEQHGRTFKDRIAGYPFTVEVLSRFKSPAEQKRLLERLATGRVDIVIGTHRLLQKDVRFKDLGLAIVDEEQRFGVEHKEFFKQLRRSVDVLTLTATPIPRTLHMALLGLRDISNLTTPPRNRRPINTKVARVSDDLLRRAILREISRGGQVFVVHPRVKDIKEFRNYIAGLVPEARCGVGHGQMDADDLEDVMASFLHGEIDVLVSTTIVESGLDIPTANTIIIHEADRFGLSELHQLRGRVGRSDTQAYCYLLLPEKTALTPEGLRRLRALEEFDDLGAGFQIALKDLEIRGAGNVLGRQQSGEIAEIGYDLYCKLLDSTVKGIRGESIEEFMEVNLQLRGAAYIPEEYVQDDKAVLELYRRLDDAHSAQDVDALKAEMIDRFGDLPVPTLRMFEEAKLRRLARMASVPYVGLDNEEGRLIFKMHGWDLKAADRALRGLPETKGIRVLDGQTLSFGLTLKAKHDEGALRLMTHNLLESLALLRQRENSRSPQTAVAAVK